MESETTKPRKANQPPSGEGVGLRPLVRLASLEIKYDIRETQSIEEYKGFRKALDALLGAAPYLGLRVQIYEEGEGTILKLRIY